MAWRLYLSDRPIRRLDILPGKPSVLAAWTHADQVAFLDLQTGAKRGELVLDLSKAKSDRRATPEWTAFITSLLAPNTMYLPFLRLSTTPPFSIHTNTDASLRLYRTGAAALALEVDGKENPVPVDEKASTFVAVDLDRALGLIAALDDNARLHLFQQHFRVGAYETPLKIEPEFRPDVVVNTGGTSIFMTDGKQVIIASPTGHIRRRMECHYTLGSMRPSPDGRLLVLSDMDAGVLRVYDAETLELTHQRFAVDLIADAKRIQLIPGSVTPSGAVGPLALTNKGILAFALAGTICVTTLARFKPLPGIAPIADDDTSDMPTTPITPVKAKAAPPTAPSASNSTAKSPPKPTAPPPKSPVERKP